MFYENTLCLQLELRGLWHLHNPQRLEEDGVVHINLENCSNHRLTVVQLIDDGVIVAPNNRYKAAFHFLKGYDISCDYKNTEHSAVKVIHKDKICNYVTVL